MLQSGHPKKLVGLVERTAEVQRLRAEFATRERQACELMSIPRSSCRYRSRRDGSMLRQQLIELAHEKPRFGYRRRHILLPRTGQRINHKRVQRVPGFAFVASGASD
jgi:HTH-like domain